MDFFEKGIFKRLFGPEDIMCSDTMVARIRKYVEARSEGSAIYTKEFLSEVDWLEVSNNVCDDILIAAEIKAQKLIA